MVALFIEVFFGKVALTVTGFEIGFVEFFVLLDWGEGLEVDFILGFGVGLGVGFTTGLGATDCRAVLDG